MAAVVYDVVFDAAQGTHFDLTDLEDLNDIADIDNGLGIRNHSLRNHSLSCRSVVRAGVCCLRWLGVGGFHDRSGAVVESAVVAGVVPKVSIPVYRLRQ